MRNAFFAAIAVSIAMLLSPSALAPVPALAQTQTVVIDCLPPWETNNRFLESTRIKHPGLSLNGFDCGDNCDIGYGLKQVIEKTYGNEIDPEVKDVFIKMKNLAEFSLQDDKISENTAILQAKGFIALVSYILHNNDYDPTTLNPSLPSPSIAVGNFVGSLRRDSLKWKMSKSKENDGVKWATPVTNVARAIDFYLALENAYKQYNYIEYIDQNSSNIPVSTGNLLSKRNKIFLMRSYTDLIEDLEDRSKYPTLLGHNVLRYDFEPGNAPLKMQVAIGYAILTLQNSGVISSTSEKQRLKYIERAFKAAGIFTVNDRSKYWNYQSADENYYWAEGPYYLHITLSDIIPFWHTVRINNLLKNTFLHSYSFADPFRQSWFLNPLHWLADLSTPDGKTPPLDDGNKYTMYNAGVLRWRSEYGDKVIGEKFAHISSSIKYYKGLELWSPLYPVAIAIPRLSVTASMLPDKISGNTYENKTIRENGLQEIVVRRTINGKQHYILLNGESGSAIKRGEGHEQGDQMQLIYYIDNISYLVDSGYDKPRAPSFDISVEPLFFNWDGWRYSTWNTYSDHNVMTMKPDKKRWYTNNGGIQAPSLSIRNRMVESVHQNINEIFYKTHGNIDLISASIDLKAADTPRQDSSTKTFANYYRNVLFIRDTNNPYLIDINAISGDKQKTQNWYHMYYHVNSKKTYRINKSYKGDHNIFSALRWDNIYKSESNKYPMDFGFTTRLLIQPFTVERKLYFSQEEDKIRESYINAPRGVGVNIKRLALHGSNQNTTTSVSSSYQDFTTLSFIRVMSSLQGINYAEENRPLSKVINGNRDDREWQYYTWDHNPDTVDVVVSRSAKYYTNSIPSTRFNNLSLHFPVPEADSFYVELPSDKNYGFARLVRKNRIWNIDSSFQINLIKSIPRVNISGPSCIGENSPEHYFSSAFGGKPPYSYSWSFYRFCPNANSEAVKSSLGPECNAWNSHARTKYVKFGGYNGEDFKIRLTLTDSSSPRQFVTSNELQVQVLSSTEGSCVEYHDMPAKAESPIMSFLNLDMSISESSETIPIAYALRQNFPNPFNPSTEILFDLPETAMVSLVVYDVLGREVARLVDNEMAAGWHRVRFDAANLPSGVYLYRIQAGDFHDTGRMLLLK